MQARISRIAGEVNFRVERPILREIYLRARKAIVRARLRQKIHHVR